MEQAQLYAEASGHRQISITALEEIIHKQTREIQTLKCDLLDEKEAHSNQLKEKESRWFEKHNELLTKLNEADLERRKQSDLNEMAADKLKQQHESLISQQNEQIKNLTREKQALADTYEKETSTLRSVVDQLKLDNLKNNELKELEIKQLTNENQRYLSELESVKNYVNNSMPTIETVKEMKKDQEKWELETLKIKTKNESLKQENAALQIRLKSMNEILTIQESQLESKQYPSSSAGNSSMLLNNEKKRQGLLGKWRNKAFELLVQLKSLEITCKQERHLGDKTVQEYMARLDEEISKNKIYANVIEDKKAELTVLNSDNTLLTEQVSQLKETNVHLENKCMKDLQSSAELNKFVHSLIKQYQTIEDSFKVANKKLVHLDQRVEFARNRLGVVKALYIRKETHLKEELKRVNVLEMTTNLSSIHGSMDPNESSLNQVVSIEHKNDPIKMDEDEGKLLRKELEQILEERNLLADRLQTDMKAMDEKVVSMKSGYQLKIDSLNNQLNELNQLNAYKQDKIEQMSEQLLIKTSLAESLSKKYDDIQKELLELRTQLSLDCERQLKTQDFDFAEKMSKMDQKLNEARREQAKAVVMMRQMERSTNREKERMENLLKSCESYYKDHLDKLQTKIVSLEKERNILMNTLRQQGNLSHLKGIEVNKNSEIDSNMWLEKTSYSQNSLNDEMENNSKVDDARDQNNVTSFWLDSKHNIEETCVGQVDKTNQDDMENSEMHKNSEILQQIRKIMGNLELSEIEDDFDENEKSISLIKFFFFFRFIHDLNLKMRKRLKTKTSINRKQTILTMTIPMKQSMRLMKKVFLKIKMTHFLIRIL